MNNPNLRLYAVSQPRNLTNTLTDFQWTNLLASMLLCVKRDGLGKNNNHLPAQVATTELREHRIVAPEYGFSVAGSNIKWRY